MKRNPRSETIETWPSGSLVWKSHARSTTKDYFRYVAIAIGSLAETATFVELAARLGYGDVDELRKTFEQTIDECRMLRALQKSLRNRLRPD